MIGTVNATIALNVLYVKKEKIYLAHASKHNSNREEQVILFMILNGEGWHYFSGLLRGIRSKHHGDLLSGLPSFFRNGKNLNRIKKYVKIKIFVV